MSLLVASFLVFAPTAQASATGDRAAAVDCEALVQAAYWDLRNEGKAGTFPLAQYRSVLEARAERTARQLAYLRAQRGRDVTGLELQAELDRMARDTQAPQALAKLFKALGNDAQLAGECLAKPLLADRLARQYFAHDAAIHAPYERLANLGLVAAKLSPTAPTGKAASVPLFASGLERRVANPATTPAEKAAVGLLREFDVDHWQVASTDTRTRWSKLLGDDGAYRALRGDYVDGKLELRMLRWPRQRFDAWWATASGGFAPDYAAKAPRGLTLPTVASGEIAHWSRMRDHDRYSLDVDGDRSVVVAGGTEVLVWGGALFDENQMNLGLDTSDGLAYNAATDTWRYITAIGAPTQGCGTNGGMLAPTTRGLWSGTKLLVFVGECDTQPFQVAAYDPVADAWSPAAPPPAGYRPTHAFSAVWTGSQAILYGGTDVSSADGTTYNQTNLGAVFTPATGQWTSYSVSPAQAGLPSSERAGHQAIWAGTTMYVFGGRDNVESCGASLSAFAFNPATGVGSALGARPALDTGPWGKVHWTGSKVVTFGIGTNAPNCAIDSDQLYLALKYDPGTRAWTRLPPLNQPHYSASSLMVGSNRLVAWGGQDSTGVLGRGAIYRLDTNTWTPMSTAGAASARNHPLVAAIGDEAVIFGGWCGSSYCGNGKRFNAVTNAWRAASLPPPEDGPPAPRRYPAIAGSGTQVFVWGGYGPEYSSLAGYQDGAVYDVVTDTWSPMDYAGAPSARGMAFGGYGGGKFFAWGGTDANSYLPRGDGALYDPVARTWTNIATPPMDLARGNEAVVWDGGGLVVWGGTLGGVDQGDGARFNPATNTWSTLPAAGAPTARSHAIATGDGNGRTLIWRGDVVYTQAGAIYNASSNAWSTVPENGSFGATYDNQYASAAWLGDRFGVLAQTASPSTFYRLDSVAGGAWSIASTEGAPTGSYQQRAALWTGAQVLVWGGCSDPSAGWLYAPAANQWSRAPVTNQPRGLCGATLFRAGALTGVWGDYHGENSGSLWHEDTRTGPLSADLAVSVRQLDQVPSGEAWNEDDLSRLEVTIANHGPETATGVTVSLDGNFVTIDGLPQLAGASCGSYPDQGTSCAFDSLGANEVRVFVVRIRIGHDSWPVEASMTATIQGGGRETDPVPGNNTYAFVLPSLRVHPVTVDEGNFGTRQMVYTVSLSRAVAWPVTFDLTTTEVYPTTPATVGEDYQAFAATGLTIPAGQLARTFAVTVNGDSVAEPNEVVALKAVNVVGAYREISTGVGTIANDEGAVVTVADASRPEHDGYVEFTATLSQAKAEDVSFVAHSQRTPWSTAASYDDYAMYYDILVTIPAGQTSAKFSFTVYDDANVEPDETVTINLDSATGPATLRDSLVTGTILNDDGPKLSINDVSVNEGDSGTKLMTFTASLSEASTLPVTFKASTANGSATAPSDYVARSGIALTIPAGQLSKSFNITINGDTAVEPLELFTVNLTDVANANPFDTQGTGYIINNDGALISINDIAVGEGNSGTKLMTFTVSLSQVAPGPVSYTFLTQAGGDATAGSDYVATTQASQVIPQGHLSKTHTVVINGDTTIEPTEVLLAYVRNPVGASVWDGQGTGYILNDDGPTLSIPDASVAEGNSGSKLMNVTVQLSQVAATDVTFGIATQDVSANSGDYTGFNLANQVIPAGQTSKVFQVPVSGDTAVEPNETFLVTLAPNPVGASLYDRQAIATIYNDDGPTLSVNDVTISEGNSGTKVATFTVSLSQAAAAPVSYNIATSNLTATAGSDYVATALNNETIPAGQLTKTFSVTLNGDTTVEANETFRVTLSNISSNATLFKFTGTGTISNDD